MFICLSVNLIYLRTFPRDYYRTSVLNHSSMYSLCAAQPTVSLFCWSDSQYSSNSL